MAKTIFIIRYLDTKGGWQAIRYDKYSVAERAMYFLKDKGCSEISLSLEFQRQQKLATEPTDETPSAG